MLCCRRVWDPPSHASAQELSSVARHQNVSAIRWQVRGELERDRSVFCAREEGRFWTPSAWSVPALPSSLVLFRFALAIAVALDSDQVGVMDGAVDKGGDACGVLARRLRNVVRVQ